MHWSLWALGAWIIGVVLSPFLWGVFRSDRLEPLEALCWPIGVLFWAFGKSVDGLGWLGQRARCAMLRHNWTNGSIRSWCAHCGATRDAPASSHREDA